MNEDTIKQLAFEISKNNLKIKLNEEFIRAMIDVNGILKNIDDFNDFKKKIYEEIIYNSFNDIDKSIEFNEAINIFNKTLEDISNRINLLYVNTVKYMDNMNNNTFTPNNNDDIMFFTPNSNMNSNTIFNF